MSKSHAQKFLQKKKDELTSEVGKKRTDRKGANRYGRHVKDRFKKSWDKSARYEKE